MTAVDVKLSPAPKDTIAYSYVNSGGNPTNTLSALVMVQYSDGSAKTYGLMTVAPNSSYVVDETTAYDIPDMSNGFVNLPRANGVLIGRSLKVDSSRRPTFLKSKGYVTDFNSTWVVGLKNKPQQDTVAYSTPQSGDPAASILQWSSYGLALVALTASGVVAYRTKRRSVDGLRGL